MSNDTGGALAMPDQGQAWEELAAQMQEFRRDDIDWANSRTGLYVFHGGADVFEIGRKAYEMFHVENGLGAKTAFPSLNRMYTDVIGMTLDLLHAPADAAGDMTAGGTESIFLAVKTCRDWWASQGRDVRDGEILAPVSAHPAFDKAAHYLGLQVRRLPVAADHRADVGALADAINDTTLMLVGSAPCYPYGVIDPIAELSDLAEARDLWLHVDACVGGFFLPFLEQLGEPVATFDFRLPGVRTISADIHKYGFAPKAASTLLHRSQAQHAHQAFAFNNWPCGEMTTPTTCGSRPGGAIAGAWAVLNYLGAAGYRERVKQVQAAHRLLADGATELGLGPLHGDALPILTMACEPGSLQTLWSGLRKQGWYLGAVQRPQALHMMVQPNHLQVAQQLIDALARAQQLGSAGGAGPRYA